MESVWRPSSLLRVDFVKIVSRISAFRLFLLGHHGRFVMNVGYVVRRRFDRKVYAEEGKISSVDSYLSSRLWQSWLPTPYFTLLS